MRPPIALALSLLVLTLSCRDEPTGPGEAGPDAGGPGSASAPSFDIRDAAHGGLEGFFFLPPLVPSTSTVGTPDPGLLSTLRVLVCDKGTSAGSGCTSTLKADFTAGTGTGGEVIRYDASAGHYIVNWHTDKSLGGSLLIDHYYRLRVFAGLMELGHADIDPLRSASDLKNYDTGNSIPLVNGRTLPIKFRIEQGAVALLPAEGGSGEIGAQGGVLATAGKDAALLFPKTALATETVLSMEKAAQPAPGAEDALAPVYDLGPDGTTFAVPVTLTLKYDVAKIPAEFDATALKIYTATPDGWKVVDGSTVNLVDQTVSAPISHFSQYTVLLRASTVAGTPAATALGIGDLTSASASVQSCNAPLSRCRLAAFREVFWASSNPAVASVPAGPTWTDANGNAGSPPITALALGSTDITATSEGVVSSGMTIRVLPRLTFDVRGDPLFGPRSDEYRKVGISQAFPVFVHIPAALPGALNVALSHSNHAVAGSNAGATVQAGLTSEGFGVGGVAPGLDTLIGSAAGYLPDTLVIEVDTGRIIVENWPATLQLGDSAPLVIRPVNPDSTIIDNAYNTAFQLTPGANVVFSNGSTVITSVPVPDGTSRSPVFYVKAVAPGEGISRVSNSNYHDYSNTLTVTAPAGFALASLGPGQRHVCGLDYTGAAWCWGHNGFNQLGTTPLNVFQNRPAAVTGGLTFQRITGGNAHTCALTGSGQAYCWGFGSDGRLGHGTDAARSTPTLVAGAYTFATISAGEAHSCAVTVGNVGYCWGHGTFGELGNGRSDGNSNVPIPVQGSAGSFVNIVTGYRFSCGLTTLGDIYCWGDNSNGQLGIGSTAPRNLASDAVARASGNAYTTVTAGGNGAHVCALDTAGQAFCWGEGTGLGNGSFAGSTVPVAVQTALRFRALSAGGGVTCGISTANETWCWGGGGYGALGNGTFTNSNVPVRVSGGHLFQSVSAGGLNVCGRTSAGETWCWGFGEYGGLGNGTGLNSAVPVRASTQ